MSEISEHPMDDFPVRPLEFDFRNISFGDPLWSRTCPEFSMFVNALGVHVPYFERYLVKAMAAAKRQVSDPQLKKDISRITGQEAHHAKNFIRLNKWLAQRYPEVTRHDEQARDYFREKSEKDSLKRLIGFTAGYETFTFLGGMIVLDNYKKWFRDSDAVMRGIWVWHQVEEVEHGSVAFEVYQHLYGEHEWYRKWMVAVTLMHIAKETLKAYTSMAKREGWLKNPFRGAWKIGFCMFTLGRFVHAALPVFRKGYHPRKHPLVTSRQNPIQIAWRRYEAAGGDVLEIDRQKMATMLGVPLEAA